MNAEPTLEDQRKRPLEALERRLAAAKAQLPQQHKRSKSEPDEKDKKEAVDVNLSLKEAQPTDLSRNSSRTPYGKDTEEKGLTYSQLSLPINENLLTTNVQFSSKKVSTVDKLLNELLQNGDSAQKYMQGSRSTKKLDNWILLDNLVQTRRSSPASHIKVLQKHSKRSKRHMSMRQLKKSGALDLPNGLRKFDTFKPMHEMWEGYMRQLVKATGKNQLAHSLLSADLHGAYILVADCKINSLTGVGGIMIRETAETFGIITKDDRFQVVPKKISVFIIQVDCWKITLQGDKLASRNSGLHR